MANLKEKRELKVIKILRSSKNIEEIIKRTYKNNYEQIVRHPNVRNEQMPIFVSFLYDQIIDNKKLPSNEEFISSYINTYYYEIQRDKSIYSAIKYRINQAYDSLVRDLHFYFLLAESNIFDDVQINYAYDIEAKQDIVVTLGDKKLGLQLFKGKDKHISFKKKQTARRRVKTGYLDYYLPLNGSMTNPVNICSGNRTFYSYSKQDVQLIYTVLISKPDRVENLNDEQYVIPIVKGGKDTKRDITFKDSKIRHSFVYVGKSPIENHLSKVEKMLKKGVRVEWVSPYGGEDKENLRVHSWKSASKYQIKIVDGNFSLKEKQLLEKVDKETTFNFGQYAIEHASFEKHLIAEAGAGSGKTETMVSRIIYLLHVEKIKSLEEIVMITFTNEAADNMKSKLAKRLYSLYMLSNDISYINWNEQIATMRILTIPSFSKSLLQDFSSELGLGRNFAVRRLSNEREEIILDVLDQYVTNHNLTYQDLGGLREFELTKLINSFWNQLEQKGIILENYKEVQWGKVPSNDIEKKYYHLIKSCLEECEKRFTAEKITNNVLTVNDLTQKISSIHPFLNLSKLTSSFKFLFVDEFQDTDDIQIELIYKLVKLTDAQLFVVGDIKQSIYRFRGANYTAFNILVDKLSSSNVNRDYKLQKNYRTTSEVLSNLENIFDVWRENSKEILPNESRGNKEPRLVPAVHTTKYSNPYEFQEMDISECIMNLYNTMKREEEDEKNNKPVELGVLVRTNYQANKIRKLLEEIRESEKGIIYDVVTGGSLFSSQSARDLLILFNALNYEEDPESFYALRQTPFSIKIFNPDSLVHLNGNQMELKKEIPIEDVQGFEDARKDLRIKPTMHVLYHFLTVNPFEEALKMQNKQQHEIEKYRLNAYRILEIAGNAMSSTLSISQLRTWLERQVATNRDEDEMEVELMNYEKVIKVMTIHKAKGLQFDTVFIPFTTQAIIKKTDDNIIVVRSIDKEQQKEIVDAGWKIRNNIVSNNYNALKNKEDDESIREEARLFYVALTRAMNRLHVNYKNKNHKNNLYNWSDLLRLGLEGEK